jgi:hypothetical protein
MNDMTFKTWLNLQAVSGSVNILGVDLPHYNTTRLQWIRSMLNYSATGNHPKLLDLTPDNTGAPSIWYQKDTGFLAVFNWGNNSREFIIPIQSLGLDPSKTYLFTDPYDGARATVSGILNLTLNAKNSVSYKITEYSSSSNPITSPTPIPLTPTATSTIHPNSTSDLQLTPTPTPDVFTTNRPNWFAEHAASIALIVAAAVVAVAL